MMNALNFSLCYTCIVFICTDHGSHNDYQPNNSTYWTPVQLEYGNP
jgi:hypothetical protein